MMIDAVTEEHLSGIIFKSLPFLACLFCFGVGPDGFTGFTHSQVVLSTLVVDYVATGKGRLVQVISQLLLLRIELLPSRNFILQYLQIGKGKGCITRIVGYMGSARAFIAGSYCNRGAKRADTCHKFIHHYAFLRNSVRRTIRVFSTRQSTSSGSSVNLIFLTTVPFFTVN